MARNDLKKTALMHTALAGLFIGSLLLVGCSQAPAPSSQAESEAPAESPAESTDRPIPNIEEVVKGYWEAVSIRDWGTAYEMEMFIDPEGAEIELLRPEYFDLMDKQYKRLKSYEILKSAQQEVEGSGLVGMARVRTLAPAEAFTIAPVDAERISNEKWYYRDGTWRRVRLIAPKGSSLQAFMSAGQGDKAVDPENLFPDDKPSVQLIPGPGVRSSLDGLEVPGSESTDQPPAADDSAEDKG